MHSDPNPTRSILRRSVEDFSSTLNSVSSSPAFTLRERLLQYQTEIGEQRSKCINGRFLFSMVTHLYSMKTEYTVCVCSSVYLNTAKLTRWIHLQHCWHGSIRSDEIWQVSWKLLMLLEQPHIRVAALQLTEQLCATYTHTQELWLKLTQPDPAAQQQIVAQAAVGLFTLRGVFGTIELQPPLWSHRWLNTSPETVSTQAEH